MRAIVVAMLFYVFIPTIHANSTIYADPNIFLTIEKVDIRAYDEVKGNCLLNVSATQNKLAAKFAQSGIPYDKNEFWTVELNFVGFELKNKGDHRTGCAVSYNFRLCFWTPGGLIVVADHGGLTVGSEPQDGSAMKEAESFADELIAAILSARINAAKASQPTF